MNQTLDLLLAHRSVRSFKDEPLPEATLDKIIEAAYRGPTSSNAQEVSVIVVRDAATRAKIAEIAGGQPWVAKAPVFCVVVADFNKTAKGAEKAGRKQIIQEDPEGLLVASFDAGIALSNLMVAARSFGLGIVPIGGMRRDPQGMIDLLHLPAQTFPVCGVSIGVIDHDSPQKPRMPMSSFRFDEVYDETKIDPAIDAYDETLKAYWAEIHRPDGLPWSQNTSEKFQTVYFPEVGPVLRKQGFLKR